MRKQWIFTEETKKQWKITEKRRNLCRTSEKRTTDVMTRQNHANTLPQRVGGDFLCDKKLKLLVQAAHEARARCDTIGVEALLAGQTLSALSRFILQFQHIASCTESESTHNTQCKTYTYKYNLTQVHFEDRSKQLFAALLEPSFGQLVARILFLLMRFRAQCD